MPPCSVGYAVSDVGSGRCAKNWACRSYPAFCRENMSTCSWKSRRILPSATSCGASRDDHHIGCGMSLLKAGGGDDRKVVRHRVRSESTPSDRTRSISASIASRSNRHGGHAALRRLLAILVDKDRQIAEIAGSRPPAPVSDLVAPDRLKADWLQHMDRIDDPADRRLPNPQESPSQGVGIRPDDGWSRISGAPAISAPHTQRHAGFQQCRWLPD
jgi:hypothetical protein